MILRGALLAGALLSAAVLQGSSSIKSGVDLVNLDPAVRPQDDLFRYVNGAWLATAEIPTDRVTWGTFAEMAERTDADLRTIAENAARSNAAAGTPARQIGDFYRSAMDEDRLTALGA